MFKLAHLSDPHLPIDPLPKFFSLRGKQYLGYFSWTGNRQHIHRPAVLDRITTHLKRRKPDHVALTGDLANLSLKQEFADARTWLERLGKPDQVSVIPGNHDAYVRVRRENGLGLWDDYMKGDARAAKFLKDPDRQFPYIRLRGKVALVGVNTAVPTAPFLARGQLGHNQIAHLAEALEQMGKAGYFRILMIHHPPLPGQNTWRKALGDIRRLNKALVQCGVELVLHGHNHRDMQATLHTDAGPAAVIGVPSASMAIDAIKPAARYNIYEIDKRRAGWTCLMREYAYRPTDDKIVKLRDLPLF